MEVKTTLDSQGRIQLPDAVQSQLGVKPGDDLLLTQQDAQWVIVPKGDAAGLGWEGNVLVHHGSGGDSADDCLSQMREERLEQLGKDEPE
jgi:bifunctional DNA-binding transcriptional regulator/antitoxin component of YhaV-PrlF toxin-antitoxin module